MKTNQHLTHTNKSVESQKQRQDPKVTNAQQSLCQFEQQKWNPENRAAETNTHPPTILYQAKLSLENQSEMFRQIQLSIFR